MQSQGIRLGIVVLTGFIALTAIGGGIALLTGAGGQRFPLEWLEGSPFLDYTIPALLLVGVVGGSSLLACLTILRTPQLGTLISMAAGLTLMGYIVGEVQLLRQVPPGPTPMEWLYFGLGLLVFLFGRWYLELELRR